MVGDRDACDHSWCHVHTATRCRSAPHLVGVWQQGRHLDLAVLLEARPGGAALTLCLAHLPPIFLPEPSAAALARAVGGLCAAAGWTVRRQAVAGASSGQTHPWSPSTRHGPS
jgi:hypothetical protein